MEGRCDESRQASLGLKTGETQGFGVDQELGLSGDSGNGVQLGGHWMMTDRSGGCSIELVTGAV